VRAFRPEPADLKVRTTPESKASGGQPLRMFRAPSPYLRPASAVRAVMPRPSVIVTI